MFNFQDNNRDYDEFNINNNSNNEEPLAQGEDINMVEVQSIDPEETIQAYFDNLSLARNEEEAIRLLTSLFNVAYDEGRKDILIEQIQENADYLNGIQNGEE
jgi:hypothetical protein